MDSDIKELKMWKFKNKNTPRSEPFFSKAGMIIFGICLILFAVFICSQGIMCDDYYWHVSVGEWIVENKEIPTTGIFSWSAADTPWFAHEWLAEIVMYWFSLLGINFGGWLFYIISTAAMFTLIYFMNKKDINRNIFVGTGAWLLLMAATNLVGSARPHAFSILFYIYLLYSLEQLRKNENSKLIYFTPLISLIWANFHGGTVMFVPILFLIYICSSLFNFNFMKMQGVRLSKKQLLTLVITFVVNMGVICVNPHGFSLITYPFSYSNVATKYVSEWQSPSFTSAPLVIGLIIAVCITLFLTRKKLQFTDLGVLGTLMLMTLVYVRFEWWLAISAMFLLLKYVPVFNPKKYKMILCSSGLIMLIGVVWILMPNYNIGLDAKYQYISPEAVAVIENTEYKNLYNTYNTGNGLIYYGYDVFLDGRSDMYQHAISEDIYQDKNDESYDPNKTISVLEEGMMFESYSIRNMAGFIDKYDLDLFVVNKTARAVYYLEQRADMNLIYSDDKIVIFQKVTK